MRAARTLEYAGLVLVLCAAWLAWPRERESAPRGLALALLDVSASATRTRSQLAPWVRAELGQLAREAEARGERVALVRYARGAELALAPLEPAELLARLAGESGVPYDACAAPAPGGEFGSELARALASGRALVERERAQGAARVRIVSDGGTSGATPAAELAALAALGASLESREPPPPDRAALALLDLRAPEQLELGAPLELAFAIDYERGRRTAEPLEARARARCFGASGEREFEARWNLPAPARGRFPLGWRLPAPEPGVLRLELELELWSGEQRVADPTPENDRAARVLRVEGACALLFVASAPRLAALESLLRAALPISSGIALRACAPEELHALLPHAQVVWTHDLAPRALEPAGLVDFVRAGGAWLASGGYELLAGAGLDGELTGDAAALLPLAPAPLEREPRELALLVDGSGSMEGEPWDAVRTAALALARAAPREDGLSIAFFNESLGAARVLRAPRREPEPESTSEAELLRWLPAAPPGGPTAIARALEQFCERRAAASEPCLAWLLSDGREPLDADLGPARTEALRARLAAARVELHAVALGAQAERAYLERLTGAPERVLAVTELEELRARLLDETQAERVRKGALQALAVAASAGALDPWPGALPAPRALASCLRLRAREGAQVLLRSSAGDDLLGLWRVGAGAVAALGSLPEESWFPALFEGAHGMDALVRWLGSNARAPRERLEQVGGELVLRGLAQGAPARIALELEPLGPGAPRERFELELALRAEPGRASDERWADLSGALLDSARAASWRARLRDPQAGPERALGPWILALDAPAELDPRRQGPLGPLPQAAEFPPRAAVAAASAPWVLLAGLVLASAGLGWRARTRGSRTGQPAGAWGGQAAARSRR